LRSKVKRYVQEPIELRTARHELNGNILVVIHVGAHPDGFVILDADGQTGDKVVFRRGDVFVRHGTASERWAPHDFGQIKEALVKRHIGIPDLVPAPPSKHEIEEPRQVQTDGVEALYQRVLVEVENVGPASARVVNCEASGYESGGSLGRVRPPAAIPPYHSRPFELNARVGNAEGLVAGTVLELKVRYEGGGHERGMHMKITYHRAGGFVNDEHSVVDDI
jgi:hypothetical protein